GIGSALAAMITELYATGRSRALQDQRERVPPLALALRGVLGPEKVAVLQAALGVDSLEDLAAACEAGRVRTIKGMGEKTERRIGRWTPPAPPGVLLPEALALADQFGGQLGRAPGALTAEAAGDLRRFTESVDELSLVVATDRPADTLDAARRMPFIAEVTSE